MASRSNAIIRFVSFAVVGLALVVIGLIQVIPTWKAPVDIFNKEFSELNKRDHVVFDVEYVLECCVSVTTERSRYGVTVSKEESSRLYVVPSMIEYENGAIGIDRYYLVEVPKTEFNRMERLCDEFWRRYEYDYENYGVLYSGSDFVRTVEPVKIDGVLAKTEDKERQYAYETMEEMGCTKDELDEMMLSLYKINAKPNSGKIMAIVGLVLLAIGGIATVVLIVKGKKEDAAIKEAIAENARNNAAAGAAGAVGANYGAGYNGAAGAAGTAGANYGTGYNGAAGTAGANYGAGYNAAAGAAGTNYGTGYSGAAGAAGAAGTNYGTGYNGATGTAEANYGTGYNGAAGTAGASYGTPDNGAAAPEEKPFTSGMFSAYTGEETAPKAGTTDSSENRSTINLNGEVYDPTKVQK